MGPIGTVKRDILPFVFTRGNVAMQLTEIKRVDRNKKHLKGSLTVKHGKHQTTEHARLTWNAKDEGFVLETNGVKTLYQDSETIDVEFTMKELHLHKKNMKLKMDKSIHEDKPLKEEEEEEEEVDEELEEQVDAIKVLQEQVEELTVQVDELTNEVEELKQKVADGKK